MKSFVERSSCGSGTPAGLADAFSRASVARNGLLRRLFAAEGKVRCLNALTGYGKSCLAAQYADMVGARRPVYWVDCKSPLFSSALVEGRVAHDLLSFEGEGRRRIGGGGGARAKQACSPLAVFDDCRIASAAARSTFWSSVERLLAEGWEVLVCSTPESFPLQGHEDRCELLAADDLAFDDQELELAMRCGGMGPLEERRSHPVRRVPCMALGGEGAYRSFIYDALGAVRSDEAVAWALGMALLGRGTAGELREVVGLDGAPPKAVLRDHPYALCTREGVFDVSAFPVAEVVGGIAPFAHRAAHAAGEGAAQAIAARAAEVLARRGEAMRSARVVAGACDAPTCVAWLARWQWPMFDRCVLVPSELVFRRLGGYVREPELVAGHMARRMVLEGGARSGASAGELARMSDDARVSDHAVTALACALLAGRAEVEAGDDGATGERRGTLVAKAKGPQPSKARAAEGAERRRRAALMLTSAVPRSSEERRGRMWRGVREACGRKGVAPKAVAAQGRSQKDAPSLVDLALAMAWFDRRLSSGKGRAGGKGGEEEARKALSRARGAALLVARQKALLPKALSDPSCRSHRSASRSKAASAPRLCAPASSAAPTLPSMSRPASPSRVDVRMLGRFEVSVDGERVPQKRFARQKTRALLALLVLNPSGLTCDELAGELWPDSSHATAKHNLYSLWSLLRTAMSKDGGAPSCLVRDQGVLRVERGVVRSDVLELRELCQQMSDPAFVERVGGNVVARVDQLYAGELLPGLSTVARIDAERSVVKQHLGWTLSQAAKALAERERPAEAIRLAERALAVDATREDAYETLFALQVACGQRPAAARTWKRYRDLMGERLGLSPSTSSREVYDCFLKGDAEGAREVLTAHAWRPAPRPVAVA